MSSLLKPVRDRVNRYFKGKDPFSIATQSVAGAVLLYYGTQAAQHVAKHGLKKSLAQAAYKAAKSAPGVGSVVAAEKNKSLAKVEQMILGQEDAKEEVRFEELPQKGLKRERILELFHKWRKIEDSKWKGGKVSGTVYHGGRELQDFLVKCYGYFALSNPLHTDVFPFTRKMESEVVRMCINLFNGTEECCGSMTSGGTESLILACKTYRDKGRANGIEVPEIIVAKTAHAAFNKGESLLGFKLVTVDVHPQTFEIDLAQVKAAINSNTVLLVGSAPQYPQGVVDPITALGELAQQHGLGLHVDCCLGGLLLPFVEKLGYDVPTFDFRVPGVTSISADTHKYGYAPKGSSVILYRSNELRRFQYFVVAEWTGGIYATPTLPGSRAGGLVAATWAAMVSLGEDGYLKCAKAIIEAAKAIEKGIRGIEGLVVHGNPSMSVVAFAVDEKSAIGKKLNIYKISEAMTRKDWHLNTLQNPASVHLCCTYLHRHAADAFVQDLQDCVMDVYKNPDKYASDTVALYGLAETLNDNALVADVAYTFLDASTATKPRLAHHLK